MTRVEIRGLPVSPGLGIAQVFLFRSLPFQVNCPSPLPVDPGGEKALLAEACERIKPELIAAEEGLVPGCLTSQLTDHLFHGSILHRIEAGMTAANAIVQSTAELKAMYSELPAAVERHLADWVDAVGQRLFRRLHGLPTPVFRTGASVILVADELSSFDLARLPAAHVAGIVIAERCSRNGHLADIAKQLGIPVVAGVHDAFELLTNGERCICDGSNGIVYAGPGEATLYASRKYLAELSRERSELAMLNLPGSITRDGKPVRLWGTIAGPVDVQPVLDAGGTGVGLFRRESRGTGTEALSEEQQDVLYGDILRRTPGPVVIRTLDAGGGQANAAPPPGAEGNPNPGRQGRHMCLEREELLLTQLRALIRAAHKGELWILLPFVSALWELCRCRELVVEAHRQVERRAGAPGRYKVGIMVELPSAALLADEYLRDFDFCCVGTNDLTRFTLAADHTNPNVARGYEPFHPAVLRLIAMTARAAHKARKHIGVVGDLAAMPRAVPLLVGLGFDFLCVPTARLGAVRSVIHALDHRRAQELARTVLRMGDTEEIDRFLQSRQGAPTPV